MTLALPDGTGASRMAFYLCRAMCQAGHRVRLVHGPPPGPYGRLFLDEMRQLGVDLQLEGGLAFPVAVSKRVAALAGQWKSHGVIGINQRDRAVALQAAHRLGVPGVLHVGNQHHFWGPLRAAKRLYYRSVLKRHCTLAVCTSLPVQQEIINDFGLPAPRTFLLPNGVDVLNFPEPEEHAVAQARQELGVAPDDLLLLNVGRIDFQKGQDLLLEALVAARLERPVKLTIVGGVTGGAAEARNRKLQRQLEEMVVANNLGTTVRFAGWRDDVPVLLKAADIYVHPARYEGWPLVLVEAMAAQKPLIASDCSGTPTGFVDGVHGYMVKAGDVQSLSNALRHMVAWTLEDRMRAGRACREMALSHYDIEVLGTQFLQRLEALS
jgi:glycosyltransferase involved in cell wall biosynthesis